MSRTIIMTGATQGIGRIAAERLLAESPDIHLVALARDTATPALSPEAQRRTILVEADLSSMNSIRGATDFLTEQFGTDALPPLHGIVANAGAQYTSNLIETAEGFEATFAVNVLANYVFIQRLQSFLHQPSRIVITVSDTHFGDLRHNLGMVPGPRWRAPEQLARPGAFPDPHTAAAGRTAYSTSKLAAIHLIHEYARRLPEHIEVLGFNPGFVPGTGLARDADAFSRFAMRRVLPLLALTPLATKQRTAGRNLADLVLCETPIATGNYIDRNRIASSSTESYDPERERLLWVALSDLVGDGTG